MGLIKRFLCFLNGHSLIGFPFINEQGCFSVKCTKCGKVESIKPQIR